MNERIQELWSQYFVGDLGYDEWKFAQLIIRECANRASWAQDTGESDIGGEILKHFGVEE
jgi:hypothetical protein